MLPPLYRLPYSVRLLSPQTISHPFFNLRYARSQNKTPRFRVIVSKRIDKRATARNRMRRLIHAFIETHLTDFPQNYDYLFMVNKPYESLSSESLDSLVTTLKEKIA